MSYLIRHYYSNKINIYDNSSFIPLPYIKTCPPPSSIYIAPTIVYPSINPYAPPHIQPAPVPINYNDGYYSNTSGGSCGSCGPCGK